MSGFGRRLQMAAHNAQQGSGTGSDLTAPGTKGLTIGFVYENDLNSQSAPSMQSVLNQMASIGCEWMRYDYQWTGSIDGTSRNGASDAVITATVAAGMNVIALFGDATGGVSATDGFCGSWMTSAVEHLSSLGVYVYEVQNEMNLGANWSSGSADPVAYTNTLKAAYPVIHAADVQATVLHTGLSPYGKPGVDHSTNYNPFDFFDAMYAAGAQGYFDASNWHTYCYPTMPNTDDGGYNTFYNLPNAYSAMQAHGDGAKQVWITEFGVATGTDGGYSQSNVVDQATQAQVLSDGYQMAQGWSWCGPALWYDWIDSTSDGDYGLLDAGGNQKTAYTTFASIVNPS